MFGPTRTKPLQMFCRGFLVGNAASKAAYPGTRKAAVLLMFRA